MPYFGTLCTVTRRGQRKRACDGLVVLYNSNTNILCFAIIYPFYIRRTSLQFVTHFLKKLTIQIHIEKHLALNKKKRSTQAKSILCPGTSFILTQYLTNKFLIFLVLCNLTCSRLHFCILNIIWRLLISGKFIGIISTSTSNRTKHGTISHQF